jgi:methyl-accepting chemotaxis protein
VKLAQFDTVPIAPQLHHPVGRVCGSLEETLLKHGTRRLRIGILPKLCLTMAVVMLVPLATIWFLDYRASVDHLSRDIEERLSGQADAAVSFVNVWMDANLRMLRQNARLKDLISMDPARHAPVLQSIAREYRYVFLAHTVRPDGMNAGRSDAEAPKDYADREYVQRVLAGAPMGRQFVISKTTGKPSFVISVPIAKDGVPIGVLAIAMDIEDLTRKVTAVRFGQTGYAFLVDDSGNIVAHPSARENLRTHPAVVAASAVEPGASSRTVFTEHGHTVIAYARRTDERWTLVAQQNYDEAYAPLRDANRNAVILLAASIIFVGVVASALGSRLTQPIRNLTDIADHISRGELGAEIAEVHRSDEIGGLAKAIDRLKASVAVAMKRLDDARGSSGAAAASLTHGR